jgi:3-oxoadipate enol-lactonase
MSAAGATIHVHRHGRGAPLVLLHCLGADHHFWDESVAALQSSFDCVTYDLPGHGQSPLPAKPYLIGDLADQLHRLADHQKLGRIAVAGISLGGLVALDFAARYPGSTAQLVLLDMTPHYPEASHAMWRTRAGTARTSGVAALTEAVLQTWFTPESLAADTPGVRYARAVLNAASGEGYALGCEALIAADLRPALAKVHCPTLLMCGDRDLPMFRDAAVAMQGAIRGSRLEWLASAGHASVLERGEAFVRAMREFLRN